MSAARPPRVPALDLLRGMAVAAMIVVNNPGNWNNVFPQLSHAAWNGVTFADLIFPTFIFIMGAAMAFTLPLHAGDDQRPVPYRRILRRAAVLCLLGLALNVAAAWPEPATLRIPGVLQRIGITYLAASLILLNGRRQQWAVVALAVLALQWVILAGGGPLEPARNIGVLIDRGLFGSHLLSSAGDPEGVLGTLGSTATALLGALAGSWLRDDVEHARSEAGTRRLQATARIVLAGIGSIAAGAAWSLLLPLNKALWTGSYAVLASGFAALCLAACLPAARWERLASPFMWLGSNALVIYFLSELFTTIAQRTMRLPGLGLVAPKEAVYWQLVVRIVGDNGGMWSSLLYAVAYALLWMCVAGLMRWRGVRVRL